MCCIGSGDCFGGVGTPMNTPMNTLGVGDFVPAGQHNLGNDFSQQPVVGRRQRKNITAIATKRQAQMPFVTPGTNNGFSSMTPRPLYVPTGGPRRKR